MYGNIIIVILIIVDAQASNAKLARRGRDCSMLHLGIHNMISILIKYNVNYI